MEYYLGQIQLFPYNFVPSNWALCEGQVLSISQNTALFSLLGTMYGGDGQTTFGLPDLRGKDPRQAIHPSGNLIYGPVLMMTAASWRTAVSRKPNSNGT